MSGDPTTFQMSVTVTVIYINSVMSHTMLQHKLTQTDWGNQGLTNEQVWEMIQVEAHDNFTRD